MRISDWSSDVCSSDLPDRLVFDLDPDEGLDFGHVKKAAIDLKQHLADIGLTSFAMLSGSKVVLNEFVAFIDLGKVQGDMSLAAVAIATFALCGFANFKIGRASCRERVGQ